MGSTLHSSQTGMGTLHSGFRRCPGENNVKLSQENDVICDQWARFTFKYPTNVTARLPHVFLSLPRTGERMPRELHGCRRTIVSIAASVHSKHTTSKVTVRRKSKCQWEWSPLE